MSKTITAQNELDTTVVRGAFINPCECGSYRLVAQEEVHVEAQGPIRVVTQDGTHVGANEMVAYLRIHGFCPYRSTT